MYTPTRPHSAAGAIDQVVAAQTVVVGCGLAGMTAALGLADAGVVLLSKSRLGEGGSSPLAQGGIAAAVGRDDSPERHAADTLAVGGGLGDPAIVRLLTRRGPERIRFLLQLGAQLDRADDATLSLTREAGHSRRRILHARDRTGAELVRTLTEAVRGASVTVADHTFAVDLVVEAGQVVGLLARGPDGRRILYRTRAVVLATGGIGRLYAHTTNPAEVTGDGLAMALRAGARLADLEFVQFHPTALASGRDPMPLLTEALRGEGAVLIDERGERFMRSEHPQAELAPRDVVARAIWKVLGRGGRAFLDAREAIGATFAERFPNVFAICQQEGLDPRRQPIPVAPAAHYHMGGISVDERGRSSLPGLWAAGEDTCTGAHGANRLASNSLLEAIVFASTVADDIASQRVAAPAQLPFSAALAASRTAVPWDSRSEGPLRPRDSRSEGPLGPWDSRAVVAELRQLMWDKVGLVRDEAGLRDALRQIARLARRLDPQDAGEARNMIDVARVVTTAALSRRESRGAHYRSDYPQTASGKPYRLTTVGDHVQLSAASGALRTGASGAPTPHVAAPTGASHTGRARVA